MRRLELIPAESPHMMEAQMMFFAIVLPILAYFLTGWLKEEFRVLLMLLAFSIPVFLGMLLLPTIEHVGISAFNLSWYWLGKVFAPLMFAGLIYGAYEKAKTLYTEANLVS